MRRFPLIIAIASVAAFVGYRLSTRTGFAAMRNRAMRRMMASLPEDSPPKLIMSVLPRLRAQNDEVLALLEEQNDLLSRLNAGRDAK